MTNDVLTPAEARSEPGAARPARRTTPSFIVAALLNGAVALALFGVGIDYLTSKEIKPHHHEILDVNWADLTPNTRELIMTLMKGTGLVALITAVSMAVLLAVPFRRREAWSRPAILIVSGAALIPTLIGTIQVRARTGGAAPWWPHIVMLAALGLAFWLTRNFGHSQTPSHGDKN